MNLITDMKMPLWPADYMRLVTGEDCTIEAQKAIRKLLARTMDEALRERIEHTNTVHGPGTDRRNGYYERTLMTSFGFIEKIRVPRGRVASIADVVLPQYRRIQPEFEAAVVNSFLLGHSTRKSKRFFTDLLGEMGISHASGSRILSRLDERCRQWQRRPLTKPFAFLWMDGKYAKIRNVQNRPYAVLFAYGVTESGERELLGFQIPRSEGTANWICLLNNLPDRGLDTDKLKLIIRDDNSGCDQAILSAFGNVPRQAWAIHLERNIADLVRRENRADFQPLLSSIFKQASEAHARRQLKALLNEWEAAEPKACRELTRRVDSSLVFYRIAKNARWRCHLKSTNILERFFRELKRFEKSRQFRFANNRSRERFYYALAYDYNRRYQRMPHPS